MAATIAPDLTEEFDAIVAGRTDVDRHAVFARLRAEAPVFFSDTLGAWVLARYDDLHAMLMDEEHFVPLTEGPGAPMFGRYHAIVAGGIQSIGNPGARDAAAGAREQLEEFLWPILEERRREPGDDLVSHLVHSTDDGVPLPNEEVISMVVFLLAAAVETTERAITSAFNHLALFTGASEILPFGAGTHHCVGSRLAEIELVHSLRELLLRVERIEPVGEPPPSEGLLLHSPASLPVVLHGAV